MGDLLEAIPGSRPAGVAARWPRRIVDREGWQCVSQRLCNGEWTLVGLWGDRQAVHMAVADGAGATGIATLECPEGHFPSVGRLHPPAQRPERAVRDLFGLTPLDAPDIRPWLDHGHRESDGRPGTDREPYAFLSAEGEGLHQIPVGPVHAGIIEPGHFRFTVNGETIVRLEARLGYAHKGIEGLMCGATLAAGARLAGRTSGDSTAAYALAFSVAAETALGIEVPRRAVWLRALMAELERLANHLGDIGAICNDAAFPLMLAHCGMLREGILRAAATAFGHRMMRDCIRPGGVTVDPGVAGVAAIRSALGEIRGRFPHLSELYDKTASLQDRTVGTGILDAELARRFGAGGHVGRASGRAFDVRRSLPYAPYDVLSFDVPVLPGGDVDARVRVRMAEVEQSLSLAVQILDGLPDSPLQAEVPAVRGTCEGASLVEGFRGDIFVWLRLGPEGRIERCHLRDPSWFQWPLLEAAMEGNIVADFPLCNKSFNCSYSGHDL